MEEVHGEQAARLRTQESSASVMARYKCHPTGQPIQQVSFTR
jgi:hypothetical protein